MVSTFSYALVMPYLQDNRPRRKSQNSAQTQQKQQVQQVKNKAQDKDNSSKISVSAQPFKVEDDTCLLYTSPSPRDRQKSRMPSSA